MTKEDKILEILCSHENLVNLPYSYKKMLAKEIADLFENMYEGEFVEWAMLQKDLYIRFGNLNKLYKFWLAMPENKDKEK